MLKRVLQYCAFSAQRPEKLGFVVQKKPHQRFVLNYSTQLGGQVNTNILSFLLIFTIDCENKGRFFLVCFEISLLGQQS